MKLSNFCPHCERRRWLIIDDEERKSSRLYSAPPWFRQKFKDILGYYPLGRYYKSKCEKCHKTVNVFPNNRRELKNKIVVVYNCSFEREPLDLKICNKQRSCYNCPARRDLNESTDTSRKNSTTS